MLSTGKGDGGLIPHNLAEPFLSPEVPTDAVGVGAPFLSVPTLPTNLSFGKREKLWTSRLRISASLSFALFSASFCAF